MEKHFNSNKERLVSQATDWGEWPQSRSWAMHELMDLAERSDNNELWLEIGHLLIAARDMDDLTTSVSDHFVELCPDDVFRQVANSSPRERFRAWHFRANRLGIEKIPIRK